MLDFSTCCPFDNLLWISVSSWKFKCRKCHLMVDVWVCVRGSHGWGLVQRNINGATARRSQSSRLTTTLTPAEVRAISWTRRFWGLIEKGIKLTDRCSFRAHAEKGVHTSKDTLDYIIHPLQTKEHGSLPTYKYSKMHKFLHNIAYCMCAGKTNSIFSYLQRGKNADIFTQLLSRICWSVTFSPVALFPSRTAQLLDVYTAKQ